MFKVKNKDNKTEVLFTSKDYPSQLLFQYKKLPLQKNKQTNKKKTIEKLENFSGPFVTFQYRPSRRRRIQ